MHSILDSRIRVKSSALINLGTSMAARTRWSYVRPLKGC
jgi:hypothetical protein